MYLWGDIKLRGEFRHGTKLSAGKSDKDTSKGTRAYSYRAIYSRSGGGLSQEGYPFRGVMVRVDEKWIWGEGGSKKPENEWTSFLHGPIYMG